MGDTKLPSIEAAAKAALRISADVNEYDAEVAALVAAAKARMAMAGIVLTDEADADPMVRLGVIVFVRANFGLDNPDAERLDASFGDILCQMALSSKYRGES